MEPYEKGLSQVQGGTVSMAERFFSYVLTRDFGFAPNPFNGMCTLATCKPKIRKAANVGDWIFGTSSAALGQKEKLIFAMKVTGKLTFNQYWYEPKFWTKKPVMNGSLKKMYGDNVYHNNGSEWIQADSHHSLENGEPNYHNIKRDTSVDAVLISDKFYYFGMNALLIPKGLVRNIAKRGPGHRCPERQSGQKLLDFISTENWYLGYHGDPALFSKFERYNGKS